MNASSPPLVPLAVWLALMAGCQRGLTPGPQSDPQPIVPASAAPQPGPTPDDVQRLKALADHNGNAIKAFPCSAQAVLVEPGGSPVRPLDLLRPLYVFAEPADDWLAVGADPRTVPDGLCRADHVYVSATRQMWRPWNKTLAARRPIELYATRADLLAVLSGEQIEPVYVEIQRDRADDAWSPVLNVEQVELPGGTVQLMEVATLTWTPLGINEPSPRLDHRPADEARQKLSQCDLLLVVDCTASMGHTWTALQGQLKGIVRSMIDSRFDVRIGVVAYRDDDPASGWPRKFSGFTRDVSTLETWISRMQPVGGGDWAERLFEAVEHALEQEIRPAAYKWLLVVCDNEGKTDGQIDVRVAARARQGGFRICALQVPFAPDYKGDRQLVARQLSALTRATDGRHLVMTRSTPESVAAQLTGMVDESRQDAQVEQSVAEKLIDGLSADQVCRELGLPAPQFQAYCRRIEQRLGDDPAAIRTRGGDIAVARSWALFDQNAMRLGVLCRQEELRFLVSVLDRIISTGSESPDRLIDLWHLSLNTEIGESDFDARLDEELRRRGVVVHSGLLSFSLAELMGMTRAERLRLADRIEARYSALVEAIASARPDEYGNVVLPAEVLP